MSVCLTSTASRDATVASDVTSVHMGRGGRIRATKNDLDRLVDASLVVDGTVRNLQAESLPPKADGLNEAHP